MKYLVAVLLSFGLCVTVFAQDDYNPETVNKVLDEWGQQAKQYAGTFTDLSIMSKMAIATGKPNRAVRAYKVGLKPDSREQFGEVSLYQLFLIYTDPANTKRNSRKAKKYLKELKRDFPDSEYMEKAEQLHKIHNI